MLHVKRASAGSGKTYQLAKTYIKLLLSDKQNSKTRQLRRESDIREALTSIMAVTFTVKATAEMKERIVEKLAALANADTGTEEEAEKIDYLKDFKKELNTNRFEIARLAKKALRDLLLHYSDFNVRTIDSFFQSVLHTFAYEASLDDNFSMELDSDYISSVGFDAALESISNSTGENERDRETLYWLNTLMGKKTDGNKWNVFARNDSDKNLYGQLVNEAKNLEKEDFQKIREELEDYFKKLDSPFRDVIRRVDEANLFELKALYEERKRLAKDLVEALTHAELEPHHLYNKTGGRVTDSLKPFAMPLKTFKPIKESNEPAGFSLSDKGRTKFKDNCSSLAEVSPAMLNDIDAAYAAWRDVHNSLMGLLDSNSSAFNTWAHYKEMLPRLAIVLEIANRKREYLEFNNALQISDTAYMLSRIIDKEDTPFVYERMGSRLKHYLIDEFQDTSRMQWENFYPLLADSESYDYDNLIIGDAKQSIYRFRNADYKLMLDVGKMFKNVVPYTTDYEPKDKSRENTNFRSKPRVVEFNNYVFHNIVNLTYSQKDKDGLPVFDEKVKEIYSDSVQAIPPEKKKDKPRPEGYVKLVFHPARAVDENDDADAKVSISNPGFVELPELILSLKERGYSFSDIGILVKTHAQGMTAVKAISRYNADTSGERITLISEENLLVGSSLSVKIIIHALTMTVQGLRSKLPENPVLEEPVDEEELFRLLKDLPSLALPSVVEAIVEKFVPANRKKEDAPFIAAFQDAVLDYCASHTGDIALFLKWWKRKEKSLSITSPEESEGVRIMTIHKAKGLEYRCVIIPFADFTFEPSTKNVEWRWMRPDSTVAGHELLPPYIPVETSARLSETAHADVRERYVSEVALDELNRMYVGFTRARDELYAYVPQKKKNVEKTAASALEKLLYGEGNGAADSDLLPGEIEFTSFPETTSEENGAESEDTSEERVVVTYGVPLTKEEIKGDTKKKSRVSQVLDAYEGSVKAAMARFEEGNKLLNTRVYDGEGENLDPRSEGKLKHRIMQMVETPADLPRALRAMKIEGLVSPAEVEKWGRELKEAIDLVEPYGWFDPEKKVYNERPIISRETINYRPDRVVADKDGKATVIDYKFGEVTGTYRKQIKNYANLLRETGDFSSVEAFLWFVAENKIEKVE